MTNGKPDPEGYISARKKLGLSEKAKCLVVEDSPAGIVAGRRAGFRVLAVATTHDVARLREAGPAWIVRDLESLEVVSVEGGKVTVRIKGVLRYWMRERKRKRE